MDHKSKLFPTLRADKVPSALSEPVQPDSGRTLEQITAAFASDLGRERLNPKLSNPDYLALTGRRNLISAWLQDNLSGNDSLRVIDVGGRIQPYRPLLEGRLRTYIAVDPQVTGLVDAVAVGEDLPFGDESFDLAFCTGVLCYVEDPARVIAEIHRVLRSGGMLLLSVPAFFLFHAETDRWRFFLDSLRMLLKDFSHVEIRAEGYSISGLCWNVAMFLDFFSKNALLRKALKWPLLPAINRIGESFDRWSHGNVAFTHNYSAFARK
jgi:SAM-dependent methyltransferase